MIRSRMVLCVLGTVFLNAATTIGQPKFDSAQPIWPAGRETEMNLFVGFRAVFECPKGPKPVLRITASSLYRVWLNGQFVGHGPARGPHGFFRVDEWPLAAEGKYTLAIEVAGYNVDSYYLLDQPAFLQAEVVSNGTVLASTAGKGVNFDATILKHRVQKVQRYSFQRPFIEYYRMSEGDDHWWDKPLDESAKVSCATLPPRQLLVRRVAYPHFDQRRPFDLVARGKLQQDVAVAKPWKDRSLVNVGPQLKGYAENDLEVVPSIEMQKIRSTSFEKVGGPYPSDVMLAENTFWMVDLRTNLTGFIGASVRCSKPTKLYITFDEILTNGDVNFKRLGCVNAIGYELQPGTYHLESFEPYTLRYLKVNVLEGNCKVTDLHLREYANDETSTATFSCSDPGLSRIFEAARQTFRQNAVDIFMDCPSRERAGWLCDSFFTSRVAFDLCGNTGIEKNFFENYLLPPSFAHLPEGMLPMCYPADHNDGIYIPNWALWFVIELEEYQARSGDREMVAALRPRLEALYRYFQKYRNEDGLLEKLDSWVFIEWSKANDFVQDVSYPTNMLYAAALAAAGRMYNEPSLIDEAERIRATIRKQSFDGEFFVDNAVRKDGGLQVTRNRSEVCQYFAFFFDVATPQTHRELWEKLVHQFGPDRKKTNAFPEIHPANAFVGNYLRLELLSRYGYPAQIKKELADFYLYMADQTGTLWENVGAYASCNHGFASHVAHSFYRDILGVRQVDTQNKIVHLKIADVDLVRCEGRLATPDGPVEVAWLKENGKITHKIKVPAGYTVRDDSRTMRYTSRSAEQAKAWQNDVRARLAMLLKIDDLRRTSIPLAPKGLSSINKGNYTLEEVEINSTADRRIRIIVTLPTKQDTPVPAVVCIGGHGSSLHSPYSDAQADRIYRGFGIALANKGYVTISTTVSQHEIYEKDRLLMGERLWDLMRCVDYLESLGCVDRSRIGCAGLSLGGEMAMWLGAMDERIAATVSAGFLTTMDHMEQNHCMCWKFDGLRELVDYADIYSLTAPRALQCQNGLKEPVSQFYVPLAREAMEEVSTIYRDMGKPEHVVLDVHEEGHVIDLPALTSFFERHLETAKKKIVFLPGPQSHGWSGHAYTADCRLLAQILNENVPAVEAGVLEGGWPSDVKVFDDAAAIVIACDGNGLLGAKSNWRALDNIAKKGVGIAFLHYALDPGKEYGTYLLGWIGGYYEQSWSINPSWLAEFKSLPQHPITRGVRPFKVDDEWYYHMRFPEDMKGVTPILTAIPPDDTRKGPDGPHSGNPAVRARLGMGEHVAWAYKRPDGGRGFGCTGGHTHWVYANNDFRKLMLNAMCWIAKVEVPSDGVLTTTPTVEQMEAGLEGDRPQDWTTERTRQIIEELNRK